MKLIARIKSLIAAIVGVNHAANSLKGYLNVAELVKVLTSALTSGTAAGGVVGVLGAILASAGTIFAAPYVGLATAILTCVIQILRFLGHGESAPIKRPIKF